MTVSWQRRPPLPDAFTQWSQTARIIVMPKPVSEVTVLLSSLIQRAAPRWSASGFASQFSALPVVDRAQPEEVRDWRLLEGGLALLLSRCTEKGARREFPVSLEAYGSIKRQMKDSGQPVTLPLRMLSELRHEISGAADATTCAAARRCMERCLPAPAHRAG